MTPEEHRILVDAIHDSATVIHKGKRMNQRIRELAEQAELSLELQSLKVEKFAELIVRECSQFVEDKFDFCGDELIIAEQILKHFGIEE